MPLSLCSLLSFFTHSKRSDVLLHPVARVEHIGAKVAARAGGSEGAEQVQAAEQADGFGDGGMLLLLSLSGGSIVVSGRRPRGVAVHGCEF